MKTEPKRCQEWGCNLILGWASKSSQACAVWKTALSGPAWWASSLCHCHLASAPARQTECHPLTGCSPPVPDRMLNKGRGMIDDVIQRTLFLSVSGGGGGALPDVYWWIWFWKFVSVWDGAIRGSRDTGSRPEKRNPTLSGKHWRTRFGVIIHDFSFTLIFVLLLFIIRSWNIKRKPAKVARALIFSVPKAVSLLGKPPPAQKVLRLKLATAENSHLWIQIGEAGGVEMSSRVTKQMKKRPGSKQIN